MQNNQLTPQQPGESKSLSILKVSLIEVSFVAVVLFLFFGVMNYFNILPISQIWPKQLGFLPHTESLKQNNTAIKQSNPVKPPLADNGAGNTTTAPSPTVSLPDTAKQTLLSFLPTIFAPSLLPRSSEITLIQENENNKFSSPLNNSQGSGKITLAVSSDGKQIYELLIFSPYKTTVSVSVQLAEKTIPQSFSVESKGTWGCKNLPNKAAYCENFWEEENGIRKGVGIQESNPIIAQKQVFLFYCEHRKESNSYSWKSCAAEFSKTGLQ